MGISRIISILITLGLYCSIVAITSWILRSLILSLLSLLKVLSSIPTIVILLSESDLAFNLIKES